MAKSQTGSDVPAEYYQLTLEEIHERGALAKKELGDDLLVLCHHYQQEDSYWFGDVYGDSLYLAQQATKTPAKYIVFCGVHFMAESADTITADNQTVILPDLTAGCSMADMADLETVERSWDRLVEACGENAIVPITYINSAASLKAFCAKHGGTVCTSSNSDKILKWALDQGKRVMFFPDQHLGRNTARNLGITGEEVCLWDRQSEDGGLSTERTRNAKVILWDGFCSVHCRFSTAQIENVRKRIPDVKVIVHPECPEEIVMAADYSGSTSKIIKTVTESTPETSWAIGTEVNLVNRLANNLFIEQGKHVEALNPNVCLCSTMYLVYPQDVLWILENLLDGKVLNQITVPQPTKDLAKQALDRMLELS
ncbi:MAG: quinolinate synthase NadA [Proteobacteria bacterium]|nr:quinolinate synthase NadA [Pseudomonadota bacterium]